MQIHFFFYVYHDHFSHPTVIGTESTKLRLSMVICFCDQMVVKCRDWVEGWMTSYVTVHTVWENLMLNSELLYPNLNYN